MIITVNISIPLFKICFTFCFTLLSRLDIRFLFMQCCGA
jgi:hypothetical protein